MSENFSQDIKIVTIDGDKIKDWDTFHSVFKEIFGFPDFYGCNMNAWNDCMGDVDKPEFKMTRIHIAKGGILIIRLDNANSFKKRCSEQYDALVECIAFVNQENYNVGNPREPIIAFLPVHEGTQGEKRWIM